MKQQADKQVATFSYPTWKIFNITLSKQFMNLPNNWRRHS